MKKLNQEEIRNLFKKHADLSAEQKSALTEEPEMPQMAEQPAAPVVEAEMPYTAEQPVEQIMEPGIEVVKDPEPEALSVNSVNDDSDYYLIGIYVDSYPNKTVYKVGEAFDPTGMVVYGVFNYRFTEDITEYVSFYPTVMTAGTTTVTVYVQDPVTGQEFTDYISVSVTNNPLVSIQISKNPNKVNYYLGQTFDTTGMVVTAVYEDGTSKPVTGYTYSPTGALTPLDTSITVTYTEGGIVKTASVAITIKIELSDITVTKLPDETRYIEGQVFDKTGMEVVATSIGGYKKTVSNYTVAPNTLSATDRYVRISYTENGITKTVDQIVMVMSEKQGYWGNKYYGNACIGENPKWNLATLGTVMNMGGISAGNNSFTVSANLIYVQQMPKKLKELCKNMPAGWKLDAHQFLVLDGKDDSGNATYKYIDSEGFVHTFSKFDFDYHRYYDIEGTGLILESSSDSCDMVIKNIQGDELHFKNGRLVESISGRNAQFRKTYEYDSSGRLTKIYDNRDTTTYLSLSYGTNQITITAVYKGSNVKTLTLNLSSGKVNSLTYSVGSNSKNLFNFVYADNGCLQTVYDSESKTAVNFTSYIDSIVNSGGYITDKISSGYMVGSDFVEVKKQQSGLYNVQTGDFKTSNEVYIKDENNFGTAYLLNGDAKIIGRFESNRYGGYKTLEAEQGIDVDYSDAYSALNLTNVSTGKINGLSNGKIQNGILELTKNINIPTDQLDKAKNLALSFYLYHAYAGKRLCAKLTVTDNKKNTVTEWVDLDVSAYEVWQKVAIPFTRPKNAITSLKLEVYSGTTKVEALVSNLKITKSDKSALYLNDGKIKFKDYGEIRLYHYSSSSPTYTFDNRTDTDLYMTEYDLLMTLKKMRTAPSNGGRYVYLCNGKKMKKALYGFSAGNDSTYCMLSYINNDDSDTSKHWFIQTDSADGATVKKLYITFGSDADTVKTTITKGSVTSTINESYNKFGQVLSTTDEHGAKKNYTYFDNGELSFENIVADGKELRLFEVHTDNEEFINIKYGGFGAESYGYNKSYGVLDNITNYDYNIVSGKYAITDKITKLGYDAYYERLESITAKEGETQVGQNTFTESGNTGTISDGKVTYKKTYTPSARSTTVYIKDGSSDFAVFKREDGGLTKTDTYYGSTTYNAITQYDKYGKILKKETATYAYDDENNDGSGASYRLKSIYDSANGVTTSYSYRDNSNQIEEIIQKKNGSEEFKVKTASATETAYTYGGSDTSANEVEYYDDVAITPHVKNTKYSANGSEVAVMCWKYESYDGFGRVTQKNNKNGSYWDGQYVYSYVSYGTRAHSQISECNYNGSYMFNNNFVVLNRKYEYDGQGNISKETETCSCAGPNSDGSLNYSAIHTYTYDSLNRVRTVTDRVTDNKNNIRTTYNYSYAYDESGRLKTVSRPGGTGTVSYDSRGRLTRIQYGGVEGAVNSYDYSYDNFGNRTMKRYCNNGSILEQYTWTRGRLLSSIRDGSNSTKASYLYNANGLRYSKTAGGVTTKFYYNGNTLMGEDRSNGKKLRYCYDREGICGFRYYNGSNWKSYTYVKNPQGDIILIKDDMGAPKVKYEYDPWGNVTYKALNLDGGAANPEEVELAKINPFRYRGYYYDEESKLYYLLSRYYDPWIGHFISPDSFDYLQPKTIGGINLYAYCNYTSINCFSYISNLIDNYNLSIKLNSIALPNLRFEYAMANSKDSPNTPSWIYAKTMYVSGGINILGYSSTGDTSLYIEAGVAYFGLKSPKFFSGLGVSDDSVFNPNVYMEFHTPEVNASIGTTGVTADISLVSAKFGIVMGDNVVDISIRGYVGYGYARQLGPQKAKFGSSLGPYPIGFDISISIDWVKLVKLIFGGK